MRVMDREVWFREVFEIVEWGHGRCLEDQRPQADVCRSSSQLMSLLHAPSNRKTKPQTCSNLQLFCPLQPGGRSREAQLRLCYIPG